MSTVIILSDLIHERHENALDKKQSFVSVYTFLRERNHMFQEKNGIYKELC